MTEEADDWAEGGTKLVEETERASGPNRARALRRAIQTGEALVLGKGKPVRHPRRRSINADSLREVLLDPRVRPDPAGLVLAGAVIRGNLNLALAHFPYSIVFHQCVFTHSLRCEQATFSNLVLSECEIIGTSNFQSLMADRARFEGNLTLTRTKFHRSLRLMAAEIGGQLHLDETETRTQELDDAICASNIRVGGDAFFRRAIVDGGASFPSARLGGGLTLAGTNIDGDLDLNHALVAAEARLQDGFSCASVYAKRAQFGSSLYISDGHLAPDRELPLGLQLSAANVQGDLELGPNLQIDGLLLADALSVEGSLDVSNVSISGFEGISISGTNISVGQRTTIYSSQLRGSVRLSGLNGGEHIVLNNSEFLGSYPLGDEQRGSSLIIDGVRTAFETSISECRFRGPIYMTGAHLGGTLQMTSVVIAGTNSYGNSLIMDRLETMASLHLFDVTAEGCIRGIAMKVPNLCRLSGVRIRGWDNEGDSLLLARCYFGRGLQIHDESAASGTVELSGATGGGRWTIAIERIVADLASSPFGVDIHGEQLVVDGDLLIASTGVIAARAQTVMSVETTMEELTGWANAANLEQAFVLRQWDRFEAFATDDSGGKTQPDEAVASIGPPATPAKLRCSVSMSEIQANADGQFEIADMVFESATEQPATLIRVASTEGDHGADIDLSSARISGTLVVIGSGGRLMLRAAKLGALDLREDDAGMPALKDGAALEVQQVGGSLQKRNKAAKWLENSGSSARGAWSQVADAYDRGGHNAEARWLRSRAAGRSSSDTGGLSSKIAGRLHGAVTGHGYYPLRTAAWLIVLVATTSLLVDHWRDDFRMSSPNSPPTVSCIVRSDTTPFEKLVPRLFDRSQNDAPQIRCEADRGNDPKSGVSLDPVTFAVANSLPLSAPQTEWAPPAGFPTYLLLMLRAAGWVLSGLLVAGMAGLLKKTS